MAQIKGISFLEAFSRFPDDHTAEVWFTKVRWPGGVHCPYCDSDRIHVDPPHPTMPYRCRSCSRYFSVRVNSVMHRSQLGYRIWAIAVFLLTQYPKGISSIQLGKILGISQGSAWSLGHRIREAWSQDQNPFSGETEVDEAYFGGKEKNKHADKKLRAGRGTTGKIPVAGALNRKENRISAAVLPDVKTPTCHRFIDARVRLGSLVYTDTAAVYDGLPDVTHKSVNHGRGEYVRGRVHINGMESFWAMLKRGYYGTYHWMSKKHLQRYVNEFSGRHNIRRLSPLERMAAVWRGLCGRRLTYAMLTA